MPSEPTRCLAKVIAADSLLVAALLFVAECGAGMDRFRLFVLACTIIVLFAISVGSHTDLTQALGAQSRRRALIARYGDVASIPAKAWWMLGITESEAGNLDQARLAFQHLAESGSPYASGWGWYRLGVQSMAAGDTGAARREFTMASECEDPQLAAYGWLGLAQLAHAADDLEVARTCLNHVIEDGTTEVCAHALSLLGDVEYRCGNVAAARAVWEAAADSGHPVAARVAS